MNEQTHSRRPYYLVFGALMVLTALTYWVATLDLGPLNDVVALGIAVTKAVLVILIFMHVRHSTRMTRLTIAAGFFWLAIMLALTLADYATRGMVGIPGK
jgi:cytochrome c oxidase subunit IV